MRLQHKLIVLIGALLLFIVSVGGYLSHEMGVKMLKEQIGQRALTLAETIASMPVVKNGFSEPDPSAVIQPVTEEIRKKVDAEFIVVGNKEGIRYSHPIPARIGQKMVGGDNEKVLKGQSIISEAVGSLGPSLRGKAPIFNNNGEVIGVVSVGFLMEDIKDLNAQYRNKIIFVTFFALIAGISVVLFIAYDVEKSIFGLQPKEIGRLYQEKQAIIESIREGIIAVNAQGEITVVNQAALKLLGTEDSKKVLGKFILDVLPSSRLMEVMGAGKAEYDQETLIGQNIVVGNRLPVLDNHSQVIGAVVSFRNKSELYRLTEELSQVKRYAEALRAQTHEYSNKLYMISGLIQLESYQEAIELITKESDVHQSFYHFVMKEIPDPMIGGLLIGKFNRANELKVTLEIDAESSFRDVPKTVERDHLVTIIGNLIDNAMEASLEADSHDKWVRVFFTDLGDDLIIEVEDNGRGVPAAYGDQIFELGFSTKAKENRGFGLALVKQAVERLGGYITFHRNYGGGTVFTAAIPKTREKSNQEDGT